jgi:hypothetical protein
MDKPSHNATRRRKSLLTCKKGHVAPHAWLIVRSPHARPHVKVVIGVTTRVPRIVPPALVAVRSALAEVQSALVAVRSALAAVRSALAAVRSALAAARPLSPTWPRWRATRHRSCHSGGCGVCRFAVWSRFFGIGGCCGAQHPDRHSIPNHHTSPRRDGTARASDPGSDGTRGRVGRGRNRWGRVG